MFVVFKMGPRYVPGNTVCAKSLEYFWQCPKEWKSWESLSKNEKVCQKHEKLCQNLSKCVKTWESVSKHERVCLNMRKIVKTWESVTTHEEVAQNLTKCVKRWLLFFDSSNAVLGETFTPPP